MDGGGPETCGVALEADHLECGSSAHAAQMIQISLPSGGATRRSRVSGAIRIRHSRPAATWCGALHHLPRKDRHTLAHTPILRPLSVRSFVPSSSLNFCGPTFLFFIFFAKLLPLDVRGGEGWKEIFPGLAGRAQRPRDVVAWVNLPCSRGGDAH